MHKLYRPSAPLCLSQYQHGRDSWSDLTTNADQNTEVWQQLNEMQVERCAYCERNISKPIPRHIEHFRQKANHIYPQGTFEWENIFGSCNKDTSCGKFKDRYHSGQSEYIVKMDVDDPEKYFLFLSDGTITPKNNLSEVDLAKAKKTIEVFNLNGSLREIRKNMLRGYMQTAELILKTYEDLGSEEGELALKKELESIQGEEFETAIRHQLTPR